jgi:hypothetical protein
MQSQLTKSNFWHAIEKDYPNAFKSFSKFIDDYKYKVAWRWLFGMFNKTKYHELPDEMQLGIFFRFACLKRNGCVIELHHIESENDNITNEYLINTIKEFFKQYEETLKLRQS